MTEQLQVKVLWKLGNIEMQYEGNESFLTTGLPRLFQELLEIYKSGSKNGELEPPELPIDTEKPNINIPSNKELDVNTIAAKLQMKGRKNLVMAACLHLVLVDGKVVFSRDEILNAMKTATHFYNANSHKSLSQYVISLVNQGYLLERSQGVYAIHGERLKELETTLAN
jgi:hypothetical protein